MIRVALFALGLVLVFAAANVVGRAVGPLERETPRGHVETERKHSGIP